MKIELERTGDERLIDAFGRKRGLELGVPSGSSGHSIFNVRIDLGIQIIEAITSVFNICLYTNKGGLSTNWFLPDELSNKYNEGIYIIKN